MATKIATTLDKYPTKDMFGETFQVKIGQSSSHEPLPASHIFTLHIGVASFYSGFFAAALKRNTFKEGQEKVVFLPEEDPVAFYNFVAFMNLREHYQTITDKNDCRELVTLHILADRYLSPILANLSIDMLIKTCVKRNSLPSVACAHQAYDNTLANSHLRRAMASLVFLGCHDEETLADRINQDDKPLPQDMLKDIFIAQYKLKAIRDSPGSFKARLAKVGPCEFHFHDEVEKWTTK